MTYTYAVVDVSSATFKEIDMRGLALRVARCGGCGNEIDPEVCCCGAMRVDCLMGLPKDHPFVPMGCDCSRDPGGDVDG